MDIWSELAFFYSLSFLFFSAKSNTKFQVDKQVGEAVRGSRIPRHELFITTKFWPHFAENPGLSLDLSLRAMKLDYVDLLLMHWPVAFVPSGHLETAVARSPDPDAVGIKWVEGEPGKPMVDIAKSKDLLSIWRKMEELQRQGKVKALGVSNFSVSNLEQLLPHVSHDTPLCVNQVEAHPWFPNTELIDYCKSKSIVVQDYCPLARWGKDGKRPANCEVVEEIATDRGCGVGQVLQSWAVQRGTVPLGKSTNAERMKQNFNVQRLTESEMKHLDALNQGEKGRIVSPDWGWPLFR